jgi:hypothetical protein
VAPQSILNSVKINLDLDVDDTDFDASVILLINGVFSTLWQLGIGPPDAYEIEDAGDTWDAFLGTNKRYNSVKTYMYLAVKNIFDPPQTGHHSAAMERQIKEAEWRLNVVREETAWVDPNPQPLPRSMILDGGDA